MKIEKTGVPQEEVIPDEENLEKKEGEIDPAEKTAEETSKIDSLEKKRGGLRGKIAEIQEERAKVKKQRKEVKEGEEIYDKEDKEKIEKEREEAKEEMDRLFSEMSEGIKSQNGTTTSQHEKLVELGKNPEFDLTDDVIDRLSALEDETHHSFLKDLDDLKVRLRNYEYTFSDVKPFGPGKKHMDSIKERLQKLSEVYERTLRNIKDSKKDLEKYAKKEHPKPEGFLDNLVTKK